ncbi:hypothetical protein [Amycolatopsis tucumanensis]|uniref:hypothetical protein n=1 Tax=Amycolatopsis tucumanensis TaxID=401106 RepID=UPI003D72C8EE
MRKGQEHVRRRGGETGDVVPVRWADLGPEKLQPCLHCCTDRWLRVRGKANPPGKPCLVRDSGQWVPGMLTWEKHPRADGSWWASVRFARSGEVVTEERSQRDLRPRPA